MTPLRLPYLMYVLQVNTLPVNSDLLKRATAVDPVLSKVLRYVQGGWPHNVSPDLKPFFQRKDELVMEAGCLMWGIRVVIPTKFREKVMDELHTSHASQNEITCTDPCVVAVY